MSTRITKHVGFDSGRAHDHQTRHVFPPEERAKRAAGAVVSKQQPLIFDEQSFFFCDF